MKIVNVRNAKEYVPSRHLHTINKRLIDRTLGAKNLSLVFGKIEPGGGAHQHTHRMEQAYYVLRGKATIVTPKERCETGPGSAIFIPPRTPHKLLNLGPKRLEILVIFSPPPNRISR